MLTGCQVRSAVWWLAGCWGNLMSSRREGPVRSLTPLWLIAVCTVLYCSSIAFRAEDAVSQQPGFRGGFWCLWPHNAREGEEASWGAIPIARMRGRKDVRHAHVGGKARSSVLFPFCASADKLNKVRIGAERVSALRVEVTTGSESVRFACGGVAGLGAIDLPEKLIKIAGQTLRFLCWPLINCHRTRCIRSRYWMRCYLGTCAKMPAAHISSSGSQVSGRSQRGRNTLNAKVTVIKGAGALVPASQVEGIVVRNARLLQTTHHRRGDCRFGIVGEGCGKLWSNATSCNTGITMRRHPMQNEIHPEKLQWMGGPAASAVRWMAKCWTSSLAPCPVKVTAAVDDDDRQRGNYWRSAGSRWRLGAYAGLGLGLIGTDEVCVGSGEGRPGQALTLTHDSGRSQGPLNSDIVGLSH